MVIMIRKEKIKILSSVIDRIIMNILPENDFVAGIGKRLDVTYSHVTKIIGLLENEKILIKHKTGRKVKIKLTEKGRAIQYHLNMIQELSDG